MDHFFGYLATAVVGLSLGLIGGGGSILIIPVLVYLFNVAPTLATSYSLFIVGCTAMIGGIKKATAGLVDFKISMAFAIPSFGGAYGSRVLLQRVPDEVVFFSTSLTKDVMIMVFFSVLMFAASISMLAWRDHDVLNNATRNQLVIFISGFGIGLVTGIVGAGGGFLIIPALVLFAGIPMKKAVGTSLIIIAAKSIIGFAWDVRSDPDIDYSFITIVSAVAVTGIFIGNYWSTFIDGHKLKRGFGWCVLLMSVYVLAAEMLKQR